MSEQSFERVGVYVDGFNLFYSVQRQFRGLQNIDIRKLCDKLSNQYQSIVSVKYFVSRFKNAYKKVQKQNQYLENLQRSNVQVLYGHNRISVNECKNCKQRWIQGNEKSTDINISLQMIFDAMDNLYDSAFLITADTDLASTLAALRDRYPRKDLIVAEIPGSKSRYLKSQASYTIKITEQLLRECQFPIA